MNLDYDTLDNSKTDEDHSCSKICVSQKRRIDYISGFLASELLDEKCRQSV